MDAMTIQAAAVVLLPALISVLKMLVPAMEGKALFYVNLALNIAVAVGVIFGIEGVDPTVALGVGVGGGLAGSKLVDLKKRGVLLSNRHGR